MASPEFKPREPVRPFLWKRRKRQVRIQASQHPVRGGFGGPFGFTEKRKGKNLKSRYNTTKRIL